MKSLPSPRVLRRVCTASIAAFLGGLAAPEPLFAQTATGWTGTGVDANWSTATNWSNGSPAQFAPPQLVRDLYFGEAFANAGGAGSVVSVNDVAAFEGFRVTFQDTTLAVDPAFVINGNGFTLSELGGVAPRIENQSSVVQTFSLTGALTLNGGTGGFAEINPLLGDLVFQNAVALAGNTRLEVYGDNGHAVTVNGVISGGASSSVSVNGNSRLILGGANTYGGDTFVNAGELIFAAGGSLAAGTTIRLGNTTGFESATVTLGSAAGGVTVGSNLVVRTGSVGPRTLSSSNTSGTNTFTGSITLDENFRVDVANGGTLDINTGAIDLKSHALTVDGLGTTRIASVIGNSTGDGTLIKAGLGTLILTGNNTFSGGVELQSGMLTVASDANLGLASGPLFLKGGNLNATGALNMSRPVLLDGASTLVTIAAASTWTSFLTGAGGFTKNGAGQLTLSGAASNDFSGVLGVNQGTVRLDNSGGDAVGFGGISVTSNNTAGFGVAVVSLGRSEQLNDNAPVVLSAAGGNRAGLDLNNFTETVGPVTITSVTNGSATIALGATGKLILNGDLVFNANRNATQNTGREVMITGTGTYATPGVGGILDLGGVARNVFVNANNTQANSDATIEAVITNGTLVKKGARVLRLGAVNTFAGVVINEGTVRPLVVGAIPNGLPLTVSGTSPGIAAVLDLNGFDYTLTAANALQFGGGAGQSTIATGTGTLTLATPINFDLSNSSQTLTISGNLNLNGVQDTFNVADSGAAATDVLISAVISGSTTGLTKTGDGVLALGGSNLYTGPVTINGGALAPRAANAFGGSVTVNAGATLLMDTGGADSAAFNSFLGAAANSITINGGTFRGANNSDRTITGRALIVGPTGATFDIAGNYNNFTEAGVTQVRFAAGTVASLLTGTGPIVKDGGGRIQFQSASPNFSGPVTINNGTAETAGTGLGNASATNTVTINGGNLALTGNVAQPLVTLNGGALSVTGASRSVSSAVNIAAPSYIFLNNFWTDTTSVGPWNLTLTGVVSGSADLSVAVNRPGYTQNAGVLILQNSLNTPSGTISVGKNLQLTSNPTSGVGSTLGTANIVLTDGKLNLRDNGAGNNGLLAYGNDVTVTAPFGIPANGVLIGNPTINVDRASGSNSGNTFVMGSLSIESQQLDVIGANTYKVSFAEPALMSGNATFNVSGSTITFAAGLQGGANTFTKTGNGTLRILGASTYGGFTLQGGTLELPNEPEGAGRTLVLPLGVGFGAGYAATQANLIDRVTLDSAGVVALGVDTTFNPNFAGFTAGLRLGGSANATLIGTITPADSVVRLGGAGGTLKLASANAVSGNVSLDVGVNGTAAGTIALEAANNFTGPVTVTGGMTLRIGSNASMGTNTSLTFDNGTLQLTAGGDFTGLATRLITIGAGGGSIDSNGADARIDTPITGTTSLAKLGAGTLTLTDATAAFGGKISVRGGTLSVSSDANLGAVPAAVVADRLQLAGGTLLVTSSFTIPLNRGVNLGTGGGTIDVADGQSLTLASVLNGANPFVKEGAGTLTITADPSASSLFTVNNGVLALQHTGSTDAPFIINSGATLRNLDADSMGDAFAVTVNGGGTFDLRVSDQISQLLGSGVVLNNGTAVPILQVNSATNASFEGTLQNGTGVLAFTKGGTNTVTMTAAHTFTGTALVNNGTLSIEGPVGALATNTVNIGDNNGGSETLVFGRTTDVWSGGELNRIANGANVTLNGRARLSYNGPDVTSTGFEEAIGALTISAGSNTATLTPAAGAQVQLAAGTLTRIANGALLLRGENFGGTGAGSSRMVIGNAPALFVGKGAAGSPAVGIIPFLVGDSTAAGAGSGFVTNSANGLRLLTNAEYAAAVAGGAGANVSLSGGETIGANALVNSLRVTGGTTTIAANAKLTVASNALLFTSSGTIAGPGTLAFAGGDGIVMVAQNDTAASVALNANIFAGLGLTLNSFGFTAAGAGVDHSVTLGGSNVLGGAITISGVALRVGNANAINRADSRVATVIFRPGGSLSLGGFDVAIRDLGLNSSGGSFVLQNAAAAPATLTVVEGLSSTWSGGIVDGVGGGAFSLRKTGAAQLTLSGTSTYTGSTVIERGTVLLNGTGGRLTNSTIGSQAIEIGGGSLLRFDNTTNSTDRLLNTASMTMKGGTFFLDHSATSGTNYSETVGPLAIAGGANTISVDQAASANTSSLTFASLARVADSNSIVNFVSNAAGALGANTRARVLFTAAPTLNDGLLGGWAYVDGTEFATYDPTVVSIAPAISTTEAESAWDATKNVKPVANVVLTANRVVNALTLGSGQSVDLGGFSLNLDSGGLIHQTTTTTDTISNGTITAGTTAGAELFLRAGGSGNVTISAAIADNAAGPISVHTSGAGTVTLTGANTYTGPTYISGTLAIGSDAALGAAPASPATANVVLNDGGILDVTATGTLNANRGIKVASGNGTIRQTSGTFTYGGTITSAAHTDLTVAGNSILGTLALSGGMNFVGGTTSSLTGAVQTIGGGLNVGVQTTGVAVTTTNASYSTAGGAMTVGMDMPGASDLNIGYRTIVPVPDTGGTATVGKLDLQGSTSFTASVNNLRLGVLSAGANAGARGELLLPENSAITAATGIILGDSTGSANSGFQSLIQFGSGTSTVTTPSTIVGGRKGNGRITVNAGGLVVFTGSGPGASDFSVARNFFGNTGVTSTGVADFTPGTFVGDLRDLVIAYKDNTAGVGNSGGATGTFTLGTSPANLVNATSLRLAEKLSDSSGAVNGTLNIGGGLVAVSGDAVAGILGAVTINTGNATGTINLNGGSLDIGGNLLLGSRTVSGNARALGNLNVNNGSVTIGGNITTTNAAEAVATVVLNGGALDVTGGFINVDTLTVQTGTLRNVAEIYTGDGITTLGTLTKSAAGTLNVEGTNTFSAETVVNAGTLLVGGSISGVVKVGSTALVGGTGTIVGSVTIADGATISPGASIGNFRTGILDLQNNSAFTLEIDTTARTTDHVAVAGTLNIDPVGTVKLAISDLNPATFGGPLPFITYEVWNGGLFTVNGTVIDDYDQLFNPESATITVGGNQYRIDYDYGGNSVALFIPEPSSVLSILGGLGVLLGARRRGNQQLAK